MKSHLLDLRSKTSRGYAHHWQFQTTQTGRKPLTNPALLRAIREEVIPEYREAAGIEDLRVSGMRMVVDAPSTEKPVTIHFISGPGVPNFNPQDWLTPASTNWDPTVEGRFFELSAAGAAQGLKTMAFGNPLFVMRDLLPMFGVADGDPKAMTHFLMMATERFGTMADDGFTTDLWVKAFTGTERILWSLKHDFDPVRYVANFGNGFQQGPRVHLHVMAQPIGFGSIFPQDYGYELNNDGTIQAAADEQLARLYSLIEARKQAGSKEEKRQIDQEIHILIFNLNTRLVRGRQPV
ncbi:hypothetical protein A2311_05555 [candidate division WOR-1 bacterium RIFOXYB2_FULL_48_7]|uniref:HIT domain-containing protein n=1 Tax=candidate division WOR-1 bacterium RIFOXYB2_FULL_48_7 TaxID=1802583 RepID=A0A1F4TQ25_UNCSA|nr:MAG: hypothetical protein A2311_05555 [candidate division WOR-1 bacterium RIFOXYB2_FULL_48_7]